jgi:hypothetical protein
MPLVQHSLLVAAGYAGVSAAIAVLEARRIRRSGADIITVFILIYVLQCCAPGIFIYACLPFVDAMHPTGIPAFDRIYTTADLQAALLVLALTACFAMCFYVATAFAGTWLRRVSLGVPERSRLVLSGSLGRLVALLGIGFTLSVASFYLGGGTIAERYANLILLRGYSDQVTPTLLNGVVATSIEGWVWLSVAALFVAVEARRRRLALPLCIVYVATFIVFAVSRRDLFVPLLLAYLSLLLFDSHWRPRLLLAIAIPVFLWIAYGKEIFGAIATGAPVSAVTERYDTLPSLLLRSSTDMGITIVESLGSISLLDLPPRLGVDHLMAILPRIYVKSLHLGLELPPRIVRLSTEAFASAGDQDIPPGLFGQMWLDFRVLGPIAWALVLGVQVSLIQRIFQLTVRTRQAAAVFVVITFAVALPLNTGSYDFTFSLNVLVVILGMLLTFRVVCIATDRPASRHRAGVSFLPSAQLGARP